MKTAKCINGFPKPFRITTEYNGTQFYLYIRCKESVYKTKLRRWRKAMRKINSDWCGGEYSYAWEYSFIYTNEPINKNTSFEKFVKDLSFILNGE